MLQDNNGFISKEELRQVMMNLQKNLTDEEVEEMLKGADVNEDGKLNYAGTSLLPYFN